AEARSTPASRACRTISRATMRTVSRWRARRWRRSRPSVRRSSPSPSSRPPRIPPTSTASCRATRAGPTRCARCSRAWSTGPASATAQVPKLTVMIGASHGAGNYAMCGRSYGPRFLFSWPNARISVMGGEQAAMTLLAVKREQLRAQGKTLTPEEEAALTAPILAKYQEESSAYYGSARLWDDGIIDPVDTRDVLGLALAVALRAAVPAPRHGVLRM